MREGSLPFAHHVHHAEHVAPPLQAMVTTLRIEGMRSTHCARAVYTALATVPGILAAEVTLGRATLEHEAPLDPAALDAAVTLAGYSLAASVTDRRRLGVREP